MSTCPHAPDQPADSKSQCKFKLAVIVGMCMSAICSLSNIVILHSAAGFDGQYTSSCEQPLKPQCNANEFVTSSPWMVTP
mmetsp:Transcript_44728/g.74061  ORF Transcript_44728/g.74061 Transcript_44728/m.74061 type:complete len:80 (+) Transcript_44728:438-677(+)